MSGVIEFLSFDIETIGKPLSNKEYQVAKAEHIRPIEEIQEKMAAQYKKPETIASHVAEEQEKDLAKFHEWMEKAALRRGSAQICAIGLMAWDKDGQVLFENVSQGENEADLLSRMLPAFPYQNDIPIVTYNGDSFDIPILITAMVRNRVYRPVVFNPYQLIDLMKYPYERFTDKRTLDELYSIYDLGNVPEKYSVSDFPNSTGADVKAMLEKDNGDGGSRVSLHCLQDCYKTGRIFCELSRVFRFRQFNSKE